MSRSVAAVNTLLRELGRQYLTGQLSSADYRQRRRQLICELTGEAVPEVAVSVAEEATEPSLPAVPDTEVRAAVALASQQVAALNQQQQKQRLSQTARRALVAALLLLALAGVALVLGFVLR